MDWDKELDKLKWQMDLAIAAGDTQKQEDLAKEIIQVEGIIADRNARK